jgi:hypothetical protein
VRPERTVLTDTVSWRVALSIREKLQVPDGLVLLGLEREGVHVDTRQ